MKTAKIQSMTISTEYTVLETGTAKNSDGTPICDVALVRAIEYINGEPNKLTVYVGNMPNIQDRSDVTWYDWSSVSQARLEWKKRAYVELPDADIDEN